MPGVWLAQAKRRRDGDQRAAMREETVWLATSDEAHGFCCTSTARSFVWLANSGEPQRDSR